MKYISILLIFFSANSFSSQCPEKNIPLKEFKSGDLSYFNYANSTIHIYHRTENEINALKQKQTLVSGALGNSNEPDSGWPSERLVSKDSWAAKELRSLNSKYFVFWASTPSNDCNLIHINTERKGQDGQSFSFLPSSWSGGFFDPCYGVGYNYSGRPVFKATYENEPKLDKRATYNLLIPVYTIVKNQLHIQSCPNKAVKRDK